MSLETVRSFFLSLGLMLEYSDPLHITLVLDYDVQSRKYVQSIINASLYILELNFHLSLFVYLLNALSNLGTGRLFACPNLLHDFLGEKH